ncbi:MAG: hypothetical protein ACUVTL_02500 [Thermoproteota archaeon]
MISIRDATKDFLAEAGLTIDDILDQMDEDPEGIDESLRKRIWLDDVTARKLESLIPSRYLNYLIFVLQTFYIINPSGMYKSMFIIPTRESVMRGEKATYNGALLVLKALGIRPLL